eukprot:jgi/Mesen1/5740/ME000029S05049
MEMCCSAAAAQEIAEGLNRLSAKGQVAREQEGVEVASPAGGGLFSAGWAAGAPASAGGTSLAQTVPYGGPYLAGTTLAKWAHSLAQATAQHARNRLCQVALCEDLRAEPLVQVSPWGSGSARPPVPDQHRPATNRWDPVHPVNQVDPTSPVIPVNLVVNVVNSRPGMEVEDTPEEVFNPLDVEQEGKGGPPWDELAGGKALHKPWHEVMPTFAKELVAGGAAGGIAKTAVAPLERVKILIQTRQGHFCGAGIGQSLRLILASEGVRGFYRGNLASVARVVPYAALHFMTYEQYRRWLTDGHPKDTHSPMADLAAGSLAGATAVISTYPLDLIRTRLAYQVGSAGGPPAGAAGAAAPPVYRGISDALLGIFRQGGVHALYRGVGPTLWGILPYAGLKFYIYEALKRHVSADEAPSIPVKLACGAISGAVGQTVTYPLDVVRRQMQVQGAPPPPSPPPSAPRPLPRLGAATSALPPLPADPALVHYRGTFDGLVSIVRTQGWRQLYAGLSINYMKMVPSVAIGFTVYDSLKHWMRVPPRYARASPVPAPSPSASTFPSPSLSSSNTDTNSRQEK